MASRADLGLAAVISAPAVDLFSGFFTPIRFDREQIEVRVLPGAFHLARASSSPITVIAYAPMAEPPDELFVRAFYDSATPRFRPLVK